MLSVLVRTNIPGSQSIYTSRKLDLSRWQIDYLSAFINFTAVFSNYSRLKTVKEYWNAVSASTGQKPTCCCRPATLLSYLGSSRPRVQWSSWLKWDQKVNWLRSTLKVKKWEKWPQNRNPICFLVATRRPPLLVSFQQVTSEIRRCWYDIIT